MSQKCPQFITPLIHNLLRPSNRLLHEDKVDKVGELSVKIGRLIAEENAVQLLSVNTHDTKQLWSSISPCGSSNAVISVFDLGPPFDDMNAINKLFADVANDPDYDLQQILSHVKSNEDEFEHHFNKFEVFRALQSARRTSYWERIRFDIGCLRTAH
jgi:hypothetical protein